MQGLLNTNRARQAFTLAALAIIAMAIAPASAQAQGNAKKSGLVSRYEMPAPTMPADDDRDTFYGTRYDNPDAPLTYKTNSVKHGGLYGQLLPSRCTTCYSPFFRGKTGSTMSCDCTPPSQPKKRLLDGLFHPFKPVGYYYAGGCWVPLYDLDPWTIGPDNFPYRFKQNQHRGG